MCHIIVVEMVQGASHSCEPTQPPDIPESRHQERRHRCDRDGKIN